VKVADVITRESPDAVINCAAWTDVDGCESDAARAERVNASGPENLARACRRVNARFLTISTDYVFDGAKEGFYTQRDDPRPLSVYARSKLAGERRPQLEYARTIVVRTGYIFGSGGRNFLSTIVQRARRGETLKAISDTWGTPTYARDLAIRLRELIELDLPGVFHVVSAGEGATFETFTREALKLADCDPALVQPVGMDSLSRPAPRPRNSKLRCLLSPALGLPPLPHWQEGLAHFVAVGQRFQR
jgi:dTDP-4-dehydrorhamnose reductase